MFAQKEVENIPLFKWSLFVQNSISFCLIIGKEKSSIEEMDVICDALSVCCPCMNPNNFLDKKTAYIFHIKNCFILGEI